MQVRRAVHRPVALEFVELTDTNAAEVAEWCGGEYAGPGVVLVPTFHGQVPATADGLRFVMHGPHDFYPLGDAQLGRFYDELVELPVTAGP